MSNTETTSEIVATLPYNIGAAFELGVRAVDEVTQSLRKAGIAPQGKPLLTDLSNGTPQICMEIWACMRICSWLDAGLFDLLDKEEADSLFEQMDQTLATLEANPRAYAGASLLTPLAALVFNICLKRLAWDSRTELNTDVFLDVPETQENDLLQVLADFLWEYRNSEQPPGEPK